MRKNVHVLGVGMVKFLKPGAHQGYEIMASTAMKTALADAGVDYADVEQA